MSKEELITAAYAALENAYAPYSHFRVGACVLAKDGRIFCGANVENASYGLCCCAERNALFAAIAAGVRPKDIHALAVVSERERPPAPCGACRQVMSELMPGDALVLMAGSGGVKEMDVASLLPGAYDKEDMQ